MHYDRKDAIKPCVKHPATAFPDIPEAPLMRTPLVGRPYPSEEQSMEKAAWIRKNCMTLSEYIAHLSAKNPCGIGSFPNITTM
jgi:hypothetical protein